MASILNEPSIMSWLQGRKEAIQSMALAERMGETQRWSEERQAFPFYTSANPHSCEHCNTIVIDLGAGEKKRRMQLPYSFSEGLSAAKGGCALYMSFIDSFFANPAKQMGSSVWPDPAGLPFWIEYTPEELPAETALLRFIVIVPSDVRSNGVLDGAGSYPVWTFEGDPAAADISTRPYELDYQSSISTNWGRSCIEYCQLHHSDCRTVANGVESKEIIDLASIPSRLLKVFQDDNNLVHVQVIGRDTKHPIFTHEVSHKGFAILSYCWGGPQSIQLTRKNVGLAPTYPITALPKTIADAAWFTHQLGLAYLWVDALCILQDDKEDKILEIPRMGQYYGDATVTLCAASAETCYKGFLPPSPPAENPAAYIFGPVALRARPSKGSQQEGNIQVFREVDYFNSQLVRNPIVHRGWTLQESLLSRRMLIFSSQHLYFSCREANASCGGREPIPKPRFIGVYESRVPGVHTIASLQRSYPAVKTWDTVVGEYTRRGLGVAADKLPAISAMAASVVRMAREERGQALRYCAGLMLGEEEGWRGELLWAVTQPGEALVTTAAATGGHICAPSWSWASLQAPVERWRGGADYSPEEDGIRLLDCRAVLEDLRSPFGAVKGGYVKLVARTRIFATVDQAAMNVVASRESTLDDDIYDESSRSALVIRLDTLAGDELMARDAGSLLMLELVAARNEVTRPTFPAGLLIVEREDGRFRRVGMFEFKVGGGSIAKAEAAQELTFKLARSLFRDCELREVCIE